MDVRHTPLEGVQFDEVKDNCNHESDWMRCWIECDSFHGACGPLRLEEMIRVFLGWSASTSKASRADDPSGHP